VTNNHFQIVLIIGYAISKILKYSSSFCLVKAMEIDERPTEKYTDVGGLDK